MLSFYITQHIMVNLFLIFLFLFFIFILKKDKHIIEIIKFACQPNTKKDIKPHKEKLFIVIKLSIMKLVISLPIIFLPMEILLGDIMNSYIFGKKETFQIIEIIILTPILEELFFRYPLRKPIIAITLPLISIALKSKLVLFYIVLPTFQIIVSYFIDKNKFSFLKVFRINFKIYLFSLAIIFAIMHIKNYENSSYIPLTLHFLGAILYSWIRIKFNTLYAILAHSLHNFYIWITINLIQQIT